MVVYFLILKLEILFELVIKYFIDYFPPLKWGVLRVTIKFIAD